MSKIKPALTAEEWKMAFFGGFWENRTPETFSDEDRANVIDRVVDDHDAMPNFHALAALALYGQPFGFVREDVTAIREAKVGSWSRFCDDDADWDEDTEAMARLASLADRIEALLPPEKP